MHRRIPKAAAVLLAAAAALGGCVRVASYVRPGDIAVAPGEIDSKPHPLPVTVDAHFLRNGNPAPERDPHLKKLAARILKATGVLMPVDGGAKARLEITADNRYNAAKATGDGIIAGLSEGLAGQTVTDSYRFQILLRGPDVPLRRGRYGVTIDTVVGHDDPPIGAQPYSIEDAYAIAVQQALLRFLWDMQQAGDTKQPLYFIRGGAS